MSIFDEIKTRVHDLNRVERLRSLALERGIPPITEYVVPQSTVDYISTLIDTYVNLVADNDYIATLLAELNSVLDAAGYLDSKTPSAVIETELAGDLVRKDLVHWRNEDLYRANLLKLMPKVLIQDLKARQQRSQTAIDTIITELTKYNITFDEQTHAFVLAPKE